MTERRGDGGAGEESGRKERTDLEKGQMNLNPCARAGLLLAHNGKKRKQNRVLGPCLHADFTGNVTQMPCPARRVADIFIANTSD